MTTKLELQAEIIRLKTEIEEYQLRSTHVLITKQMISEYIIQRWCPAPTAAEVELGLLVEWLDSLDKDEWREKWKKLVDEYIKQTTNYDKQIALRKIRRWQKVTPKWGFLRRPIDSLIDWLDKED